MPETVSFDVTRMNSSLDAAAVSKVSEMAWNDRRPFEAIHTQFALGEAAVIPLIRQHLKNGSYRLWRQRVQGHKKNIRPCGPRRCKVGRSAARPLRGAEPLRPLP